MKTCSNCNTPLPDDAPGGLCPQCLMQGVLTPGDRIQYFGNYELIEEAGSGGMGIVWRARQTGLDRVVALKMIRSGVLPGGEDVKRFHAEASAAAQLQHPNIVAIHEVGDHDGQHYYSMDFIEGKNLHELCASGPLEPRRAAELIAVIADAVQFAHQRGILHRDLKPQNVMVDAAGVPHLTDFGLAKRMDLDSGLTQTGAVMGSPSYMAPEQAQARHDRIGTQTDVYALGAILHEMLTGRAPFRGDSPAETMMRVINDEPVAPSKLNADVRRDLDTICLKCMEKDPSRRYATAREVAEDVRRFLAGDPILARPASALRKMESWIRRHPWALAAAASALVLLLACAVDLLFEQNKFLRAQQATPGLVRAPGPRAQQVHDVWGAISSLVFFALLWSGLLFSKESRRFTSWAQIYDPKAQWKPRGQVSTRLAMTVGAIALVTGIYAILLAGKLIEVYVWEGSVPGWEAMMLYPLFWFSMSILLQVSRSMRGASASAPTLAPDALAQIEAEIRDGEMVAAIKRVRTAAPGTGLAAARDTVERIAARIEAAAPGTLIQPGGNRRLNVGMVLLTLAVEAIIFGILWGTMPPPDPALFLFNLASGFLFGGGIMVSTRLKGFWPRVLVILPGMAIVPILQAIVLPHTHGDRLHFAPYFTGIVFGVFVMISAFTRRRRAQKGTL